MRLETSSEKLRLCLYIVQAYVLLSPQEFLSDRGTVVVATLNSILGDLIPDGIVETMRLLETCLRALPHQGAQLIKPMLTKIFE